MCLDLTGEEAHLHVQATHDDFLRVGRSAAELSVSGANLIRHARVEQRTRQNKNRRLLLLLLVEKTSLSRPEIYHRTVLEMKPKFIFRWFRYKLNSIRINSHFFIVSKPLGYIAFAFAWVASYSGRRFKSHNRVLAKTKHACYTSLKRDNRATHTATMNSYGGCMTSPSRPGLCEALFGEVKG